jgi:hypothetical protein
MERVLVRGHGHGRQLRSEKSHCAGWEGRQKQGGKVGLVPHHRRVSYKSQW